MVHEQNAAVRSKLITALPESFAKKAFTEKKPLKVLFQCNVNVYNQTEKKKKTSVFRNTFSGVKTIFSKTFERNNSLEIGLKLRGQGQVFFMGDLQLGV